MTAPTILVVDDEPDIRELLEIALLKMGMDVDSAESLEVARKALARRDYALVLTDMRLPDGMGIELVREIAASGKGTPVAVITAYGSADNAVQALKAGAFDYLSKPVALDQLRMMVQSAVRVNQNDRKPRSGGAPGVAAQAPAAGQNEPGSERGFRLVGQSALMVDLRRQISMLARSMAPVAINGESGTGKELAARDIHAMSPRADRSFVAVNCGAIPEALVEAEFFGYRKGAFTGAVDDREGFFQAAHGGTLMLDEVADLPLPMQVKLLRAIQERRVRRVGATNEEPVDVRIISATHQNLAEWVEQGKFRQDLYYRLNVIELQLPPLRERRDDLGLLAAVILARLAESSGVQGVLSADAMLALQNYHFPGNVRELENILERALAFAADGKIEVSHLRLKGVTPASDDLLSIPLPPSFLSSPPPALVPPRSPAPSPSSLPPQVTAAASPDPASLPLVRDLAVPFAGTDEEQPFPRLFNARPAPDSTAPRLAQGELPPSLPDYLDDIERDLIRQALAKTSFNRTRAAELLGVSFRQLRYRMQRLSIYEDDE